MEFSGDLVVFVEVREIGGEAGLHDGKDDVGLVLD